MTGLGIHVPKRQPSVVHIWATSQTLPDGRFERYSGRIHPLRPRIRDSTPFVPCYRHEFLLKNVPRLFANSRRLPKTPTLSQTTAPVSALKQPAVIGRSWACLNLLRGTPGASRAPRSPTSRGATCRFWCGSLVPCVTARPSRAGSCPAPLADCEPDCPAMTMAPGKSSGSSPRCWRTALRRSSRPAPWPSPMAPAVPMSCSTSSPASPAGAGAVHPGACGLASSPSAGSRLPPLRPGTDPPGDIVALARKPLSARWRFSETGLAPTGAKLA